MGTGASDGPKHRYQTCRDPDCPLPYCRIYQEGYQNGDYDGHLRGYREGDADGYARGFPDGIAACPRPHTGG
jgi:hypothetical protein